MCSFYTCMQLWKELCECGVGVVFCVWKVNMHFSPYPLISHWNAILLFHVLFHFSPDPGKNWFGIFFSFVSFFRHSNFPCPRIYIIDFVWFASLWQMFLFLFQLDWLGLAGQFENWQAPKWLLLWHCQRQDSAAMFLKGDIVRATWCSEDPVLLSNFLALRQIKLLTDLSVP